MIPTEIGIAAALIGICFLVAGFFLYRDWKERKRHEKELLAGTEEEETGSGRSTGTAEASGGRERESESGHAPFFTASAKGRGEGAEKKSADRLWETASTLSEEISAGVSDAEKAGAEKHGELIWRKGSPGETKSPQDMEEKILEASEIYSRTEKKRVWRCAYCDAENEQGSAVCRVCGERRE